MVLICADLPLRNYSLTPPSPMSRANMDSSAGWANDVAAEASYDRVRS